MDFLEAVDNNAYEKTINENVYSNTAKKPSNLKYFYRHVCTVILVMVAVGSFFVAWYNFIQDNNYTGNLMGKGNLSMALIIYTILYYYAGRAIRAFKIGVERITNIVVSQVLTVFIVDLAEIFISMAITNNWRFVGRLFLVYFVLFLGQSLVLGAVCYPMIVLYYKLFPPIDILEIYSRPNGMYEKLNRIDVKYRISEKIQAKDHEFTEIIKKIEQHEAVLINDLPSKQKNRIVKICFDLDKRVYVVPKLSDIIMRSSESINLIDTPMFMCRNREITPFQRFVKRTLDIILSGIALIVFSPVMAVTAIAIHREDNGSVFFRQERVTEGGRHFEIIKFRSMKEGGDSLTPTGTDDDRITKVGHRIRAWRIDELPQLINILKGDMSIVGPRPERYEHVDKYSAMIPEFKFRSKMKGGLTGYAQVYGRYNTSALDKLKLDLFYITNYSIITDAQIIFETVKILFFKESTEGFHNSGSTGK